MAAASCLVSPCSVWFDRSPSTNDRLSNIFDNQCKVFFISAVRKYDYDVPDIFAITVMGVLVSCPMYCPTWKWFYHSIYNKDFDRISLFIK